MIRIRSMLPLLAIFLAGCTAAVDGIAESPTGYVGESAAHVAAADWPAAETVEIVLDEYSFRPASLEFRAGRPYRLRLTNAGAADHFFVSEGFFKAIAVRSLAGGADRLEAPRLTSIVVPPGTSKALSFVPVVAGRYPLECSAPFHALFGMDGDIAIVDG